MMGVQKLGERQQTWVDALRSGKYEQGYAVLRGDKKFCCLGVACDLVPGLRWVGVAAVYQKKYDSFILPKSVVEYYGFYDTCGRTRNVDDPLGNLTSMNDYLKLTFDQIADAVEADPVKFFREEK